MYFVVYIIGKSKIMKMFIPEIGTDIILRKPWTFELIVENRNLEMFKRLFDYTDGYIDFDNKYEFMVTCDNEYCARGVFDLIKPYMFNNLGSEDFISNVKTDIKRVIDRNPILLKNIKHIKITLRDKFSNSLLSHHLIQNMYQLKETFTVDGVNCIVDIQLNYRDLFVTIPEHTELKVDRIYIRKGNKDFSSVTFISQNSLNVLFKPKKKLTKQEKQRHPNFGSLRFFAKLSDVNKIEFDTV